MNILKIIFSGYRGRRNFGFSKQNPNMQRPRVRTTIQVGGVGITR